MDSWDEVVGSLRSGYTVEREFETGAIIEVDGVAATHRVLVSMMNPGYGSDDYVTIDLGLGPEGSVNLEIAAKCVTNNLVGGVICNDGFHFIRNGRALATLTPQVLGLAIAQLEGAAGSYVIATSQ